MPEPNPALKLFAYSNRTEYGLMIVGGAEALQRLAGELEEATRSHSTVSSEEWPRPVLTRSVAVGPYRDSRDFTLSFHIEAARPAETIVPMMRSGPPFSLLLGLASFAAIGIIAIAWLAWNHVF